MATRVPPGPLNLAFGQALSGANTNPSTRESGRQALMAVLGGGAPATAPVLSASSAATLDAVSESAAESRRSADLAALQQRLADFAEADRQRRLAEATDLRRALLAQTEAERTSPSPADRVRLAREAREARERQEAARQRERLVAEVARRAEEERFEIDTRARNTRRALDDENQAPTLLVLEQRLQRNVDAVQRALNALTEDLAHIRDQLAKKTPAPTGNEESPFREGERHLDIGES